MKKLSVLDKVKIKSWDKMKKEYWVWTYGFSINGEMGMNEEYIKVKCAFSENMKHLCWQTARIESIDWYKVSLCDRSGKWDHDYAFSIDMLELVEKDESEKPTRWDTVMVRDQESEEFEPRIYLTTVEWADYPFICVRDCYEARYSDWKKFAIEPRREMKVMESEPNKEEESRGKLYSLMLSLLMDSTLRK